MECKFSESRNKDEGVVRLNSKKILKSVCFGIWISWFETPKRVNCVMKTFSVKIFVLL